MLPCREQSTSCVSQPRGVRNILPGRTAELCAPRAESGAAPQGTGRSSRISHAGLEGMGEQGPETGRRRHKMEGGRKKKRTMNHLLEDSAVHLLAGGWGVLGDTGIGKRDILRSKVPETYSREARTSLELKRSSQGGWGRCQVGDGRSGSDRCLKTPM